MQKSVVEKLKFFSLAEQAVNFSNSKTDVVAIFVFHNIKNLSRYFCFIMKGFFANFFQSSIKFFKRSFLTSSDNFEEVTASVKIFKISALLDLSTKIGKISQFKGSLLSV